MNCLMCNQSLASRMEHTVCTLGTSPCPIALWLFEIRCSLLLTAIFRFKQKASDTISYTRVMILFTDNVVQD